MDGEFSHLLFGELVEMFFFFDSCVFEHVDQIIIEKNELKGFIIQKLLNSCGDMPDKGMKKHRVGRSTFGKKLSEAESSCVVGLAPDKFSFMLDEESAGTTSDMEDNQIGIVELPMVFCGRYHSQIDGFVLLVGVNNVRRDAKNTLASRKH